MERLVRLSQIGSVASVEAARTLGLDPDVTRVHLHRLRKRLSRAGLVAEVV